jgi:hypothetical protein
MNKQENRHEDSENELHSPTSSSRVKRFLLLLLLLGTTGILLVGVITMGIKWATAISQQQRILWGAGAGIALLIEAVLVIVGKRLAIQLLPKN